MKPTFCGLGQASRPPHHGDDSVIYNLLRSKKKLHIYGAEWDGTATTLWSRTDDAAGFTNPSPAVNNGAGSSPFDGKMPWAGMVKETDEK